MPKYFENYISKFELVSTINDEYLNEIMKNFVAIKYIGIIRNSIKEYFKLNDEVKIDYSNYYELILITDKEYLNKMAIWMTMKPKNQYDFSICIICVVDCLDQSQCNIKINTIKQNNEYSNWENYGNYFEQNIYGKLKEMWKFDYETYFNPVKEIS